MKLVRRIPLYFGSALAILFGIALLLYLSLVMTSSFQEGRHFLGSAISSLSPDFKVEQPHLSINGDMSVHEIVLLEDSKTWLSLHDTSLSWSPSALLWGAFDIQEISAERIVFNRLPKEEQEPATSERTNTAFPFRSVSVEQLTVKQISLPAALTGTPSDLSLSGQAFYSAKLEKLSGELTAQRLGAHQGSAQIEADFNPTKDIIKFNAFISEAENGIVSHLLKLQDAPGFTLRMTGGGPLSDWSSTLRIDLDSTRTLDGEVRLRQSGNDRDLTATLSGELAQFLPSSFSSVFAGKTRGLATAKLNEGFLPLQAHIELNTGTLTAELNGEYQADTSSLLAKAQFQSAKDASEELSFQSGTDVIRLGSLDIKAKASGRLDALSWSVSATSQRIDTADLTSGTVQLAAKGEDADVLSHEMSIPIDAQFQATNIDAAAAPKGHQIDDVSVILKGTAFPQAQKVQLNELLVKGAEATAQFDLVELSPRHGQVRGKFSFSNLGVFSAFVQRDLTGSAEADITALADFEKLSGEIKLEGTSRHIQLGDARFDPVLSPSSRFALQLSGTLDRDDPLASDGRLKELQFKNSVAQLNGHGTLENRQTDGTLTAHIHKLSLLEPRVTGALNAHAVISGNVKTPDIVLKVQSNQVALDGIPLENLELTASGEFSKTTPNANVNLTGRFKNQELSGRLKLTSDAGKLSLPELELDLGGNTLRGHGHAANIAQLPRGIEGNFLVSAPDLSSLTELALTDLGGQVQGNVNIQQKSGHTQVAFNLTSKDLLVAQNSVGSLSAKGWIDRVFTRPVANAQISLDAIDIDGVELKAFSIKATPLPQDQSQSEIATVFSVDAQFAESGDTLKSEGVLRNVPSGVEVTINTLQGMYKGIKSNLRQPTTISLLTDRRFVTSFQLDLGGGSLMVSASDDDQLDISANLSKVPLSLANAFIPSLSLKGTLNGDAHIFGSIDRPEGKWTMELADFSAKPLQENSILPLQLQSSGSLSNNVINQQTTVRNGAGLNVQASGRIGLTGMQSLSLTSSGYVPLDVVGAKLIDLDLGGSGGFQVVGQISGSVKDPQFSIKFTPSALTTTQLSTGMTLTEYTGAIEVSRKDITVDTLSAKFNNGGTATLTGRLGLGASLPAQVDLVIDNGRYVNGTFVSALINASLALRGSLSSTGTPSLISGNVTINQADIEIPSSFSSSINPVLVRHLNAPKPILSQANELAQDEGRDTQKGNTQPSALAKARLDVDVNAPGKIFIRGRGVNAEAGGSLNIGGTVGNIQTVGGFSLVRGRMDILSKRLNLTRGNVTFSGSLIPSLDFAATAKTGANEVSVLVTGQANMPNIDFISVPNLPKDEILSQLLFGESVQSLSPIQLARLAGAVATLTGSTSSAEGPLGVLRNLLGVSDVDLNFDAAGNPELAVGGYVNERIYLGVTQEPATGDNAATVDIDVTKFLKLRGEASSDGDAKAGFYYEREYD